MPLKIHGKSGVGGIVRSRAEQTVRLVLSRLLNFTFGAIVQDLAGVTSKLGPKITTAQPFRDFGMTKVKHLLVNESNEGFARLRGNKYPRGDVVRCEQIEAIAAGHI